MHVRVRAAAGAAAALLVAIAGGTATAHAADLHCQASTAKIAGIGLTTPVEPLTAGSTGPCANDSVTPLTSVPGALDVHALADTTYNAATKAGKANGGLLSLDVLTPADVIPQLPTNTAVGGLPLISQTLTIGVPPLSVPLPVLLDVRNAVRDYLAPLQPAVGSSLLSTGVLMAHASVGCLNGSAVLSGTSELANVAVAGNVLPINDGLHEVVSVIGAQSIPLSELSPYANDITILDPLTHLPIADALTADAAKTALATLLPTLTGSFVPTLPATTLDVTITPGGGAREGDTLTQTAATAKADLGGIHLLDANVGVAKVSADAGACALPPKTTPVEEGGVDAITATGSVADQILACSDRRLVLMDVLRKGNMVKLLGAANRDYAGRRVAIRLRATNAIVGHATVQPDGSFQTTAPLPPRRFMTPARRDLVRYSAEIGHERSLPLKLERRMVVSSMSSAGGKVRITGRVIGPLTTPSTMIRLMRRLSCNKMALVKEFQPGPGGRFDVTVDAPEGQVAAVYRMTTFVRANRHNRKRFPTFTLPRGVALDTR